MWALEDEGGALIRLSGNICDTQCENLYPIGIEVKEDIVIEFEFREEERDCGKEGEWMFHKEGCAHATKFIQ